MSMLAEPKKKIKWGLNPRGNLWADDDSKFGQKLLEKMGWQKGKGLGKYENGRVNAISVVSKRDNKGVGWDDKRNNWVAHQDEFNILLQNLNKEHNTTSETSLGTSKVKNFESSAKKEPVSLEVRSKSFKSHIHYKKFVCGKDVSQYSSEDMNCIFGKKLTDDVTQDSVNSGDENSREDTDKKNVNDIEDPTFTSSSSMADYFAEKMKAKNLAFAASSSKTNDTCENEQPLESVQESGSLCVYANDEISSSNRKKLKKRKRVNFEFENAEDSEFKKENISNGYDSSNISGTNHDQDNQNYGFQKSGDNRQSNFHLNDSFEENSLPNTIEESDTCKRNKKRKNFASQDSTNDCDVSVTKPDTKILVSDIPNGITEYNSSFTKPVEQQNLSNNLTIKETSNQGDGEETTKEHPNPTVTFGNSMQLPEFSISSDNTAENTSTVPKNSAQKSAKERLSDMLLLSKYTSLRQKSNVNNNADAFKSNMENWVSILKLARKQSRYKFLYKKFQEHPLLSSTNLLSIEGYGTTLDF